MGEKIEQPRITRDKTVRLAQLLSVGFLKRFFIFCKCFRTTCTVPLIDYIDGNDYSIEPQQGGDEDGFARGAWDWSLLWKRIPLSHKEKAKRKHKTEPYR